MEILKKIEGTLFLVIQSKIEDVSLELLFPKSRIVDLRDSFGTFTAVFSVPGKLRGTGVVANFVLNISFIHSITNVDVLALPEATVSLHQHTWVNWGLAAHLRASRGCDSSKNEESVRHNIY